MGSPSSPQSISSEGLKRATPDILGAYRIVSLLGEGGTGTVYEATHVETGERAALKTVRLPHPKYLATLRHEIHTLSRLKHPDIVNILAHGVADGMPWYAMEHIAGENLRRYSREHLAPKDGPSVSYEGQDTDVDLSVPEDTLSSTISESLPAEINLDDLDSPQATIPQAAITAKGWWTSSLDTGSSTPQEPQQTKATRVMQPFSWQKWLEPTTEEERLQFVLTLVRRLCEPLGYIHGEGLVHRDLKPENILLKPDGQPTLIDFGLLTRFQGQMSMAQMDGLLLKGGTAAYMAPEQFRGERVDARADIYALGCIFYELLVGHPPFIGNEHEIAAQHMFGHHIPPSIRVKSLPKHFDDLVMAMLARAPKDRIGYATSVAAQLEQWGAHPPPALQESAARLYLYLPQIRGRQAQAKELHEKAKALEEGESQVVFLTGGTGTGKTRVGTEFIYQLSQTKKMRLVWSNSRGQQHVPMSAFRPFLLALADHIVSHNQQTQDQLLGRDGKILGMYEESLFQALGQRKSDSFSSLPSKQARRRLFGSLRHTLGALAALTPTVLVLDNLHDADELSLSALSYLLQEGLPPQLMLLGILLQEEGANPLQLCQDAKQAHHIHLNHLTYDDVSEMLADMLASKEVPEGFVRTLFALSEGNPFFVTEYVQAALEQGIVTQDHWGRWGFAPGSLMAEQQRAAVVEEGELPAEDLPSSAGLDGFGGYHLPAPRSLRTLLQERLSRLDALQTDIVSALAVLGTESDEELLLGMLSASQQAAYDALKALERTGILTTSAKGRWRFAQGQLREWIYLRMPGTQQQALHWQAAMLLEEHASPAYQLAALARHWNQANEPTRERESLLRAAAAYGEQFSYEEAIVAQTRAIALFEEQDPARATAQLALARWLSQTGLDQEALSLLEALIPQLQEQPAQHAKAQIEWSLLLARMGELHSARQGLEEARKTMSALGDLVEQARIISNLGNIAQEEGHPQQAKQLYEEALALLAGTEGTPRQRQTMGILSLNMANLSWQLGDIAHASRLYEEALASLREVQDTWREGTALAYLGVIKLFQARHEEAIFLLEQALQIHRDVGYKRGESVALGHIALALHEQGKVGQAMEAIEQAIALTSQLQYNHMEGVFRVYYNMFQRRMGTSPEVLHEWLDQAEPFLALAENDPYLALVYCERGHLFLLAARSAESYLTQAIRVVKEAGLEHTAPSELGQAISRLRRAQERFEQGDELLQGEAPLDIPPLLRELYTGGQTIES